VSDFKTFVRLRFYFFKIIVELQNIYHVPNIFNIPKHLSDFKIFVRFQNIANSDKNRCQSTKFELKILIFEILVCLMHPYIFDEFFERWYVLLSHTSLILAAKTPLKKFLILFFLMVSHIFVGA
jgi:hypothetical protein